MSLSITCLETGTDRSLIRTEDMTEFILAVIMVNRMRRHLKHLDLIRIERNFHDKGVPAHALGALPVVLVVQRPGRAAAEGIILLDLRHKIAQDDEQYADAAADQNADEVAAVRQLTENSQLTQPAERRRHYGEQPHEQVPCLAELLKI